MRIVQLGDFGSDGDAVHRMVAPSKALGAMPGVEVVNCRVGAQAGWQLAADADVVVVQFHDDWDLLGLVQQRRDAGRVTVFEANDYFFDLQAWSPLRQAWSDRTVQELYVQLLRACDGVQTSSRWLAGQWRSRGAREVAVFDNHLGQVPPLPEVPVRPLTIGWAGSPGHFADWWSLTPVLEQWLAGHPQVRLAVMTSGAARGFVRLPAQRYSFVEFGSWQAYLDFLGGLDIGLAPLLPTGYNRGRSDVKFLEYASRGVTGVYARLDPYEQTVVDGQTGLMFADAEELVSCLDRLHDDVGLRERLRTAAHAHVTHTRLLADRIEERLRWYESLLDTAPTAVPAGETAGGYQEIRWGAGDVRLEQIRTVDDDRQGLAACHVLVDQHPDHVGAALHLGRLLNNAGRPAAALPVLERVRTVTPDSALVTVEVGRSLFLLQRHPEAKTALVGLVTRLPGFVPGWRALVRMLRLSRDPEAQVWARQALEVFPTCYPLGLDAIDALAVNDAAVATGELITRVAPTLGDGERATARHAFHATVAAVVQARVDPSPAVVMLAAACAGFPESAMFAGWYGDVLHQTGQSQAAVIELARAAELFQTARAVATDLPLAQDPPLTWTLARTVLHAGQGNG